MQCAPVPRWVAAAAQADRRAPLCPLPGATRHDRRSPPHSADLCPALQPQTRAEPPAPTATSRTLLHDLCSLCRSIHALIAFLKLLFIDILVKESPKGESTASVLMDCSCDYFLQGYQRKTPLFVDTSSSSHFPLFIIHVSGRALLTRLTSEVHFTN